MDVSNAISVDQIGNVFITGYTYGFADGGLHYFSTAVVSKYDAEGNFQWTKHIELFNSQSHAASADGLGNVYIAGGVPTEAASSGRVC